MSHWYLCSKLNKKIVLFFQNESDESYNVEKKMEEEEKRQRALEAELRERMKSFAGLTYGPK